MTTKRFYFRCPCCLSTSTVDLPELRGRPSTPPPYCMTCSNPAHNIKLDCMGFVHSASLLSAVDRPPCNHSCTFASGPACECSCCAENHGKGKLVTILESRGLPMIKPVDGKAETRRDEFRAALILAEQAIGRLPYASDIRAGIFVDDRYAWMHVRSANMKLQKASRLKVHSLRLKRLAEITAYCSPKVPA